ncbi:hypothetical protein F5Y15DRAFT_85255 [Xylariaceae sp. FL0016]|nr:hypothetical protein F5Y15DRAFT_85255 [Xylariaceae sp. FL0016]
MWLWWQLINMKGSTQLPGELTAVGTYSYAYLGLLLCATGQMQPVDEKGSNGPALSGCPQHQSDSSQARCLPCLCRAIWARSTHRAFQPRVRDDQSQGTRRGLVRFSACRGGRAMSLSIWPTIGTGIRPRATGYGRVLDLASLVASAPQTPDGRIV